MEFLKGHALAVVPLLVILHAMPLARASGAEAELPRVSVDTSWVPPTGRTIAVAAGGNLQSALDAARPGDSITLQAGATFTGPFTLPRKTGSRWVIVRSSAADSNLPPPGTRVTPSHAGAMAKIVAPRGSVALQSAPGAHHFRFVGIEFRPAVGTFAYNLIQLGADEKTEALLAHHIIFDRCYIHGDPNRGSRRGIGLNSASTAIVDSYLSEFKEIGADSQAIWGYNGPGPFTIVNNYIEGAGENIMFGGAAPRIANLVPADIEIRRNHVRKALSWYTAHPSYAGIQWSAKNLLELKNAVRVLVEGNIFEYNWAHAQAGFAIQFTVRNEDGTAPWSAVQDITFTRNIVRHTGQGVNIGGVDDVWPSGSRQPQRIVIRDNLFDDVNGVTWGYGPGYPADGRLFQILSTPKGATADVVISHNTGFQSRSVVMTDGPKPHAGFVFRDNIVLGSGVIGSGTGDGRQTLTSYFLEPAFAGNVLIGGRAANYSRYPGNFFPATINDVGFADLAGGDCRLAAASPYRNAGTDGRDPGADLAAVAAATAGVIGGSRSPRATGALEPVRCKGS